MKHYDLLVFIGRFQPVHVGHVEVIQTALEQASNVLILVGSANQPRTSKNPWTYEERSDMLYSSLTDLPLHNVKSRVFTAPLRDQAYNDQKWVASVQQHVETRMQLIADKTGRLVTELNVAIIGHSKDESSYYLKMFPQWDLIEHQMNEVVSATDLRRLMFEGKSDRFLLGVVNQPVLDQIVKFKQTAEFKVLAREYEMIKAYKKSWEAAPYPPTFVTVDAVVVQSGHVLLIQRKAAPGEGLWAMPGGFLEYDEWIVDGMIRELRQETKLKVPTPVLIGSIKHVAVFDKPDRSLRGRTITHAYLIELPPGPLPPVKGSDDARKAKWIPINEIDESKMFEDHYHVIQDLLDKL